MTVMGSCTFAFLAPGGGGGTPVYNVSIPCPWLKCAAGLSWQAMELLFIWWPHREILPTTKQGFISRQLLYLLQPEGQKHKECTVQTLNLPSVQFSPSVMSDSL